MAVHVCVCVVRDSHMCMRSSGFNYVGGKGGKKEQNSEEPSHAVVSVNV